jgi:N-acetyl-gamma-glutamyl-phosphate reductase
MQKIKVGVFGGTGYTGLELIGLLVQHPGVKLEFATSESSAGENLSDNWPLAPDIILRSKKEIDLENVDCVFLCLPHTQSAGVAREAIDSNTKIVDLSADLRISDPLEYEHWYGVTHPEPDLLPVPYGLPELGREERIGADVIANPGCYATSILLGLMPLVRKSLILPDTPIIIDAKSGVSGAGRTPERLPLRRYARRLSKGQARTGGESSMQPGMPGLN